MTAELNARGHECSENTVAEAHAASTGSGRRRRGGSSARPTRTTACRWPTNVLARDFDPAGPNAAWCADITYIPTARGVAVPGGGRGPVQPDDRGLVDGRDDGEPAGGGCPGDGDPPAACPGAGLVAHSDRGSQYASDHYQRVLAAARDHVQHERGRPVLGQRPGGELLRAPEVGAGPRRACSPPATRRGPSIFEYLEAFYNRVRRHSSLGFVSPAEFERTHNQTHR